MRTKYENRAITKCLNIYLRKTHFTAVSLRKSLKVSFSQLTTEDDVQVDRIQAAEVVQYCKSVTICNFAHLNKGQTNKNPLRWHVNWQTNCLIAVCSVKGASRPWVRGQPKFTSDWSLMAHGGFYCTVAVATKLFSSFPTGQNVLFLSIWNVSCEPNGSGACMYQFVSVAGPALAPQWIYGPLNPRAQWPQLMRLPQRHAHTKGRNDDIWSKPAQSVDPQ